MRKLLANHRVLTPIWALTALAVVCLCVGSLLLSLDYRAQLGDTRATLDRTKAADVAVQTATYKACLLRNSQSRLALVLEQADVAEQRSLIRIEKENTAVPAQFRAELVRTFERKLAADLDYLAAPPVDCSRLKTRIVTSSSRGR